MSDRVVPLRVRGDHQPSQGQVVLPSVCIRHEAQGEEGDTLLITQAEMTIKEKEEEEEEAEGVTLSGGVFPVVQTFI